VRLNEGSLVQLGQGVHRKFIEATESECTKAIAVSIAGNKELTKRLLDQASIPVPRGVTVRDRPAAVGALDSLAPPLAGQPLDGNGPKEALTKPPPDALPGDYLKRRGPHPQDRPPAGERIFLRETANLSTGGTARDVTDEVHPDVARMCEMAARIVGLDICG